MYFGKIATNENIPQSAEPELLESALNQLITENGHLIVEPWDCHVLMTFLDDGPVPSCLNTLAFRLMKNKVSSFDTLNPIKLSLIPSQFVLDLFPGE